MGRSTVMKESDKAKRLILFLEEVRLKKNMSRYRLSKLTDLPESTIKRTLDFMNEPLLSNFLKIADALEVKVSAEVLNEASN
ncbi:helix-turn-helix domain-containing protein, partial [Weeksella virosa]